MHKIEFLKKKTIFKKTYRELNLRLQALDNVTNLGVAVLKNFDVEAKSYWYWIGVAALLGFTILFNVLFTFALMYLNRKSKEWWFIKWLLMFQYVILFQVSCN